MKKLYIIALTLLITTPILAQKNGRMEEKMREYKMRYITETLALSEEDSTKFWPVYDAFEHERIENRRAQMQLTRGMLAKSDEQLKIDLDKILSLEENNAKITRKYFGQFQEVISVRQIAALFQAEQNLKRALIEKFSGGGRRRISGEDSGRF